MRCYIRTGFRGGDFVLCKRFSAPQLSSSLTLPSLTLHSAHDLQAKLASTGVKRVLVLRRLTKWVTKLLTAPYLTLALAANTSTSTSTTESRIPQKGCPGITRHHSVIT